jgi:hypothetical protein
MRVVTHFTGRASLVRALGAPREHNKDSTPTVLRPKLDPDPQRRLP